MIKRIPAFIISIIIVLAAAVPATAAPQPDLNLTAQTAILVEQTTGRQLYAKDVDKRMYPASMTKILTALVAMDYLKPDEFIVLGDELHETPAGSSIAYLAPGETITAQNLLRGLLIMSGNDAGCAIAYCVAKKAKGVSDMKYDDAEALFADLMNKKAAALGATGSHFTNPHGFQDENHYSTAHDIALFSRAFMQIPLLKDIVDEQTFNEKGAGDNPPAGAMNIEHDWKTHNQLIMTDDVNYYTYANGIKTGFTNEAGNCVAASAEKDGVGLICVVFNSPDPGLWNDSKALLNYGFDNFAFADVQKSGELLERAVISRPQLGMPAALDVLSSGSFRDFFNKADVARIKRDITYDAAFLDQSAAPAPSGAAVLQAPIVKGQVLGKVSYSLDGQVIYTAAAVAAANVDKRTLGSDFLYYLDMVKTHLLIKDAIPFWAGGAAILAALIIILTVRHKRKKRNQGFSMYRWR